MARPMHPQPSPGSGASRRVRLGGLGPLLVRAVRRELALWRAVHLVLRRREDVAPGGVPIGYSAQLRPKFWVFALLFPFEIVVVHLVVPWEALRTALLVVGILSALWFLGVVATLYVYPHSVDRDELRVRWSAFQDHRVPLSSIGSVRRVRRTWESGAPGAVLDGTLVMETEYETNLLVDLVEPVPIDLGRRGSATIRAVALWADDPVRAAAAIRTAVAATAR